MSKASVLRDDDGPQAPSQPPTAEHVVRYTVMSRPVPLSGTFSVRVAAEPTKDGKWRAPLRAWHVRESFPYEGEFFFRAKFYPKDHGDRFVWMDMTGDGSLVPRLGTRLVEVKATPLWDTEPADADAEDFPHEPEAWDAGRLTLVPAALVRPPLSAEDLASLSHDLGGGGAPSHRSGSSLGAAAAAASGAGAGKDRDSVMSLARRAGRNVGAGVAGFFRRAGAAAAELIEGGAPPSDEAMACILSMQSDLRTPFRAGNEDHEEALVALWSGTFDEAAPFERKGRAWVEAGCISEDPGETFAAGGPTRAAGLLGLHAAVHCASAHAAAFRTLLERHSGEDDTSLRLLGTVNALVRDLAGACGVTADDLAGRRAAHFRLLESAEGFYELVWCSLVALGVAWGEMGGTQARFTDVLEVAVSRAGTWLLAGPVDVPSLRRAVMELDRLEV